MSSALPRIAIVGATGAVGIEFLRIFGQRGTRFSELRLLASARSAGKRLPCAGADHTVSELHENSLRGIDIALFSAGGPISKQFGPVAAREGAVVIDNSSAFRMDPGTPLVVPEINPSEVAPHRNLSKPGIIANPNCSTIILLVPLNPLRERFGVRRAVVSTYQAASGAGAAAMEELETQTRAVLDGGEASPRIFHEIYAFNLFSHNSKVDPQTGRNVEEQKMIDETRKIWRDPGVEIAATCVRVPVMRAHAESVTVTLDRPATEADVRAALTSAPGIRVIDDRAGNRFPTPLAAAGEDDVLVGRIRPDETQPRQGERFVGWQLFVCGDQLRKGAALNAVQIAELLLN